MDAAELRELIYGPREELAEFFGVSLAQLRRYLSGASRIPAAIARLARARFAGELEEIYGPAAAELRIQAGELIVPGWRRGISLHELRTLWVRIQAAIAAESRAAVLERDLEDLRRANDGEDPALRNDEAGRAAREIAAELCRRLEAGEPALDRDDVSKRRGL